MSNKKIIVLIFVCITILVGCGNNTQDTIPYVPVNIQINLQDPDFQSLSINGGFVYVTGGSKGILVYRENSTSYKAFERNCTFEPNGTCARIKMDNSLLFMVDTCCSSQFNLDGSIISGPAPYNLLQYNTSVQNNYLYINN